MAKAMEEEKSSILLFQHICDGAPTCFLLAMGALQDSFS